MPHIHKRYDFVVSVFIVRPGSGPRSEDRVLLVHHKKYKEWLPIGGHIELDEDPEMALFREIKEECGLKVKLLNRKPSIKHPGVKPILTPSFVDAHRISKTHKHVAFVYFAKTRERKVKLHRREHHEFGWFTKKELDGKKLDLTKSIRFYCREALKDARFSRGRKERFR